jgi:hypothetical protein
LERVAFLNSAFCIFKHVAGGLLIPLRLHRPGIRPNPPPSRHRPSEYFGGQYQGSVGSRLLENAL